MKLLFVTLLCLSASLVSADQEHNFPRHKSKSEKESARQYFPSPNSPQEQVGAYWYEEAQQELQAALSNAPNTNLAKNVIMFLGDGMSIQTVMAARVYDGQLKGNSGEENYLSWEQFAHLGLAKTYGLDVQVPDSAGTATAFLCGTKTNRGLIGFDGRVETGNCETMSTAATAHSIAKWSQDAGKRTGVVTSTRVTHATPANIYAHIADRDWESDARLPAGYETTCPTLKDIAAQLIDNDEGKKLNVIMGGGFQTLDGSAVPGLDDPIDSYIEARQDGRILWQEWLDEKAAAGQAAAFVRTESELDAVDLANTEYLMGIYANSHVPYEYLKVRDNLDIPTLAEMTQAAITVLSQEPKGYFLLVEGGRIDMAHHTSTAKIALDEAVAMSDAVQMAKDMTNQQDTLIIVTSDHSHTMTVAGYPERGNDIFEITDPTDTGRDGLPYTTLSYATGPGFYYDNTGNRPDLNTVDTTTFEYVQGSLIDMGTETHGGEDVAIYANGPFSHLFHSAHEQSYIAHVMAYASCVNGYTGSHCL